MEASCQDCDHFDFVLDECKKDQELIKMERRGIDASKYGESEDCPLWDVRLVKAVSSSWKWICPRCGCINTLADICGRVDICKSCRESSVLEGMMTLTGYNLIRTTLNDPADDAYMTSLRVKIKSDDEHILIRAEGYGGYNHEDGKGYSISLEFCEGRLVLRVWPDINSEDPVKIDLEGARKKNRVTLTGEGGALAPITNEISCGVKGGEQIRPAIPSTVYAVYAVSESGCTFAPTMYRDKSVAEEEAHRMRERSKDLRIQKVEVVAVPIR